MEMIYREEIRIPNIAVTCHNRLKLSWLLGCVQDVAGQHSALLGKNQLEYNGHRLFWAVTRHRVQITRLPKARETITLETWPCPTTRVAYPRACVAYDQAGNELFRVISLWVLMDTESRAMILPGKSGIEVAGITTGKELGAPASLTPLTSEQQVLRQVNFTDLDVNGHMNNAQYLNWVEDILPSGFYQDHPAREFVICYLNEAREGQQVEVNWTLEGDLRVDAHLNDPEQPENKHRIFAARVSF